MLVQYPIGNARTSYVIPDSVTSIGDSAFFECTSLSDLYYNETEKKWNELEIGIDNDPLLNAVGYFLPPIIEAPTFTEDSKYTVNESVDAIIVKPSSKKGESLETFLSNFAANLEFLRVVDENGIAVSYLDRLDNTYSLQLLDSKNDVTKTYKIVMLGDIDHNGRLSLSDVSGVQSVVLAKPAKDTIDFIEANVDGNSRLSVTDASALQSFLASGNW